MILTHLVLLSFFDGATATDGAAEQPPAERTTPDGGGGRRRKGRRVQVRGKWYDSEDKLAIRRALDEWVRDIEAGDASEPETKRAEPAKVITLPTADDTPDVRIPVMAIGVLAADELRQFQRTLRLLQVQEQAIRALAIMRAELEDDEDAAMVLFQ